jgi:hypothetical protein
VDYWEAKVEAVLEYFRCEQSLRKAISIIRRVGATLTRPKEVSSIAGFAHFRVV